MINTNDIIKYLVLFIAFVCIAFPLKGNASENEAFWDALKSGDHFIMMRHAIAPGMGDPPGFIIDSCSTQRNLSDAGRKQAANIGQLFSQNNIKTARVYSSQWCRCLETAELLDLGQVSELPALNSFFGRYEQREKQLDLLRRWLAAQDFTNPLVLVTHQVNITGITGVYPSSGELILVKMLEDSSLAVIATLATK